MTETGWGHMLAYRRATPKSTHRAAINKASGECNENCLMIREIKCVCRCGGVDYGAYMGLGNNGLLITWGGSESVNLPTVNVSVRFIES